MLDADVAALVLRSRQFPTFAFNSSKKFWTRINSYPASRLGTVSKRVGDPRRVEAVGDSRLWPRRNK